MRGIKNRKIKNGIKIFDKNHKNINIKLMVKLASRGSQDPTDASLQMKVKRN